MEIVFLIARILFAALFLGSAFAHLTQTEAMAGYAGSKGVPQPKLATQAAGVLMLVGALSVLLGVWGDLGSLFLVAFLAPTAVIMHNFWKETDATNKEMEMVQFLKDVALAGAALAFFVVFRADPDLTITSSLF
ncbi:DoxX family protein [Nocardioides speluncae]|uniref:DoxX family protein n=1 Tax=Nocardioides speluncae TaxID=2670337 RepID=UPI000D68F775|nr:DoxX family protein [Nocardioides speluncae]